MKAVTRMIESDSMYKLGYCLGRNFWRWYLIAMHAGFIRSLHHRAFAPSISSSI